MTESTKPEKRHLLPSSILPPTKEILQVTRTVYIDDKDLFVIGHHIRNSELARTNLRGQPDPCMATSSSPAWNILG